MDQKMLLKHVIDFQKVTFDNSFNAMANLQEQGAEIIAMFLAQAPWLPEQGRELIINWINAYRKGREEFRKCVDASFEKVERFFSEQQGPSE